MNIRKVATSTEIGTLDLDLIKDELYAVQPYARTITKLGFVGSAAAGDCICELLINGKQIGKYENSSTGTVFDTNKDMKSMDEFVPANGRVQFIVRDAGGTNSGTILIEFGRARSTGTKRTFRRSSGTRRRSTGTAFPRRTSRSGMY